MMTITEMMAIGIQGTRDARRVPAAPRAGQSRRHSRRRGRAAEGGRSTTAMARTQSLPRPVIHGGEVLSTEARRAKAAQRMFEDVMI